MTEPGRAFYRYDAGAIAGYCGLDGVGADRLLRSLVVLHDLRGRDLCKRIVAALECEAGAPGALRLHLLTNTAPRRDRGFDRVHLLCPASAAYPVKSLEPIA